MRQIPPPFRYNRLKHQARWLADYLKRYPTAFLRYPALLQALGRSQFDTYYGPLNISQVLTEVRQQLQSQQHWQPEKYLSWLNARQGYRLLTLSDNSRWVVRAGDLPERYIHLHPARYSTHSRRIKAPAYKMLILTLSWELLYGVWPDPVQQNQLRAVLGLPPTKKQIQRQDELVLWMRQILTC